LTTNKQGESLSRNSALSLKVIPLVADRSGLRINQGGVQQIFACFHLQKMKFLLFYKQKCGAWTELKWHELFNSRKQLGNCLW